MTDIATGWTVNRSVPNRARRWAIEAIDHAATPFPILGIDSDNGSGFINHHFLHYCEQYRITFTRVERNVTGCALSGRPRLQGGS